MTVDLEAIRARFYGALEYTTPVSVENSYADIPDLLDEIKRLTDENTALRNELCLKCGQYRQAHKGACNGCRWERKEYDCKRIV